MAAVSDVEVRCSPDGRACVEVVARLEAADRARALDLEPDHPTIADLRAQAARWADVHRYGQGPSAA